MSWTNKKDIQVFFWTSFGRPLVIILLPGMVLSDARDASFLAAGSLIARSRAGMRAATRENDVKAGCTAGWHARFRDYFPAACLLAG